MRVLALALLVPLATVCAAGCNQSLPTSPPEPGQPAPPAPGEPVGTEPLPADPPLPGDTDSRDEGADPVEDVIPHR